MCDKQEADSTQDVGFIELKVEGFKGVQIMLLVRKAAPMFKIKKTYCDRASVPLESLEFIYEGRRISDFETPEMLEMETGVVIQAILDHGDGRY